MHELTKRVSPQLVSIIGVTLVGVVLFAVASPGFVAVGNVRNLLLQASVTAIAASGMTLVIMGGWIDLSIGSLMNLAMAVALTSAGVQSAASGSSSVWTYVIALTVATAGGLLNGLLIWWLNVDSLLVTLGTLTLFSGLSLHITGSRDLAAQGPIAAWGTGELLGVPLPVLTAVVVVAAAAVILRWTKLGRYVMAVGGAPRSAAESGLPTNAVRLAAFAISGLCAGIAGVILAGQIGIAQASFGVGFEFTVITAVVVGGTSLAGGRGSVLGSALGALLLALILNGLNRLNVSIYIYPVITGLSLLIAVVADSVVTGRLLRRSTRARRAAISSANTEPAPKATA